MKRHKIITSDSSGLPFPPLITLHRLHIPCVHESLHKAWICHVAWPQLQKWLLPSRGQPAHLHKCCFRCCSCCRPLLLPLQLPIHVLVQHHSLHGLLKGQVNLIFWICTWSIKTSFMWSELACTICCCMSRKRSIFPLMEDVYNCTGVDDMEVVGEAVVKCRLTGCESALWLDSGMNTSSSLCSGSADNCNWSCKDKINLVTC